MARPWVLDPDPYFRGRLLNFSTGTTSSVPPPKLISSAKEFLTASSDACLNIPALFMNWNLDSPGALNVIRGFRTLRPVTPIYLLYEDKSPLPQLEINRLGLAGTISKILNYPHWTPSFPRLAFSEPQRLDPRDAPQIEDYTAVPITDFFHERPLLFDVHLNLPQTGKMLKIIGAGDTLNVDRVAAYLARGVRFFYISEASHRTALSYVDLLAHVLLTKPAVTIEARLNQTFLSASKQLGELAKLPLSDVHIDAGIDFLTQVSNLIHTGLEAQAEVAQALVKNALVQEHTLLVTAATGLLTIPLGIQAQSAYRTFGLSAYFQDIGMTQLDSKFAEVTDPEPLGPEDRKIYETHPALGAKLLETSGAFDESVIQAVAQHHERRDGSGFPRGASASQISTLASTVGLADQLIFLLQRRYYEPQLNVIDVLEKKIFNGYPLNVVEAVRAVFFEHLKGN
ncbi:HD domain-containing phosphohydrolase [Bdellovibrionota bacterium FG-1]